MEIHNLHINIVRVIAKKVGLGGSKGSGEIGLLFFSEVVNGMNLFSESKVFLEHKKQIGQNGSQGYTLSLNVCKIEVCAIFRFFYPLPLNCKVVMFVLQTYEDFSMSFLALMSWLTVLPCRLPFRSNFLSTINIRLSSLTEILILSNSLKKK